MQTVGFTGSRQGMTNAQETSVRNILEDLYEPSLGSEFHHGNCVGADADALGLAMEIGYWVIAHPADGLGKLQLSPFASDESRNYKSPQRRNKDIVNETSVLIACPKESTEPPPRRGQGTWATVRYARKKGTPYTIVWPDGTTGA